MADVVGVVFRKGTKTYRFDPAGIELSRGDRVVVETAKGLEIAQVVEPPHQVDDDELSAPLSKVVRLATGEDLQTKAGSDEFRKEAMITCRELIASHGLDMKLVDAEVSFSGDKITFSFFSDERVDFRALVADLARTLKMRIELRQIGAREEARIVGGLGPCGRHLCCNLFRGDEEPVSIRMAKEQNLPLNPTKISGLCGRLMCCLKYEQEQYLTFRKEAPPRGTKVRWGEDEGVITGFNVLKDAIVVRFEDGSVSDVKLSGCEFDEEGCLVCPREVKQLVVAPAPELPTTSDKEAAEQGEGADAGDGKPDSTEPKKEGRSRSRRSRSRRSKSRSAAKEADRAGAADPASDRPAGDKAGEPGKPGEEGAAATAKEDAGRRSSRRRSSRKTPKPAGDKAEPAAAERDRSAPADGEEGAAAAAAPKKPRRRRRPRKRTTAAKEGGSGDGGGSGGASAGGGGSGGGDRGGDAGSS